MAQSQLALAATLAASPSATRAQPVRLTAVGNTFAYPSGNCVIVRRLDEPGSVLVCGKHTSLVTAVRLSPTGTYVASGDRDGNVFVWVNKPDTKEIYSGKQLGGAVLDIAWSDTEQHLVIVGEGKSSFAAVITTTGNTVGNINGHSKNILSADFRRARPYRIATGSADSFVGLYEGVPFKFVTNVPGHKNSVTCVRYSPDLEMVASVSGSSDIMLTNGLTGEKVRTIPSGHTGTILSLDWTADGESLITASADKCVHITRASDGSLVAKACVGTTLQKMQQGVVDTPGGALSVSFGGELTLIDKSSGAVTKTWLGHRTRLLLLHHNPSGMLVSVSTDGEVRKWANGGEPGTAVAIAVAGDSISAAFYEPSSSTYFMVAGTNLVSFKAGDSEAAVVAPVANNETGLAVLPSGVAVLMSRHSIVVVDVATGKKGAEERFPPRFDASSIAAGAGDLVACGGDKAVKVYRAASSATAPAEVLTFSAHHTGTVSAVAFSKDGRTVASGDATRNIFVWSVADGSVLYSDLVFHSLRVSALDFDATGNSLVSGSVDSSIIVWDLPAKTRKTQNNAHRGGVTYVAFTTGGEILSAGGDCCIRKWKAQ